MLRIKKIITNSMVCVIDEKGDELIVRGKGIGFQKHRGERVDEALVEATYRMEDKGEQKKLRELMDRIPEEHLVLTAELIEDIKQVSRVKLNESLLITLADHISFAIQRKEEGIEFSNPLKHEIMAYYPTEYHLGQQCIKQVEKRLNIELNKDEASFIALHIVNAQMNTEMSEMYEITSLIDQLIVITEEFYGKKFDTTSLDFSRFVVHLRYFVRRIFTNTTFADQAGEANASFRQMIAGQFKIHYACAKRMEALVKKKYGKELTDEELTYLTIHLKRINMNGDEE